MKLSGSATMANFSSKGSAINKFAELALRFRSDLLDPKSQNHRNSINYFEDFVIEDRGKIA